MRRTLRLGKAVQVFIAALLAALLLTVLIPSPKAEAAYEPFTDSALWVDGTSARPGAYATTSGFLFPQTGDLTIEIWAKFDSTWATNTKYTLWTGNGYSLYGRNGNFWLRANDASDTDTLVAVPSGWFHVAVVFSPTNKTAKLVLNGTSTSWSRTYSTFTYSGGAGAIGSASFTHVDPWNGRLDQFKIFNSALSDLQISQSMNVYSNVGITSTPALFGFYDMNRADGTNSMSTISGTALSMIPISGSAFTADDIKSVDTASRPGYTIYTFSRTYLPAEGGWRADASARASKYEYLVVAGGGGGGGNRGGGGGAGGLVTGQVAMPFNGVISIVVGAGGYSGANGTDSRVANSRATVSLVTATGGGAGGTTLGANINGASGGSGGGASLCYATGPVTPTGGAATAGQGNNGAGNDSTNCATATPENRHTGGGGGSGSAGSQGSGGSTAPTASTSPMTRPNGGAGTSSSITGASVVYAAGGGGANALASVGEGFVSSFQGLGGSSIGGDGAAPGARGANAVANTGSGGGGGGFNANNTLAPTTGGYGSSGIVVLAAPSSAFLSTPAAGAVLNAPIIIQPTITVPTGIAAVTGCSAIDANGSSVGVSVTCSAVTGSGSTVTLTDLTFTSGTPQQYYTVVISVTGYDDIQQEMILGHLPASVSVAASAATTNFFWDGSVLLATSASQAVTVLATDVRTRVNAASAVISASGAISVSSGFTTTTSGNGITFKSLTYSQAASVSVTTVNGAVTIWNTNPNAPTGTAGVTGVLLGTNAAINTAGGSITIGGGANPLTDPVTAEVAVNLTSGILQAGAGNISIRANSVLNANLASSNYQMNGLSMASANISTTGSGAISIFARATGSANGYIANAVYISNNATITSVNGPISITATNSGAGNTNGVFSIDRGKITSTGTGSITLVGDSRGTTTTSTSAPITVSVYGLYFGTTYNDITTVDGNISVTAYGGNFAASTVSSGLNSFGLFTSGSKLHSTGAGTVTIYGQGGNIGNTVASRAASSIGVYNGSWIGTTSAPVSVQAVSGAVGGVAGSQYGYWGEVRISTPANYNSASILTTTGSISVIADTVQNLASGTGITAVGFYAYGAKVKSTSANISITGTACSTCSTPETSTIAYGVQIMNHLSVPTYNEFMTGGSGSFSLVGRADNESSSTPTAYGISASFDSRSRASLSTQTGNLSITGYVSGALAAHSVYLTGGLASTTSGTLSISGSINSPAATSGNIVWLAVYTANTGSGNLSIASSTTNTTVFAGNGVLLNTSTLSSTSGPISVDAQVPALTNGNAKGLYTASSSMLSGNSATQTVGGAISITAKTAMVSLGQQSAYQMENTTIDTFNAPITIVAGEPSAVSNTSRTSLFLVGTSTLGLTASNVDVTAHGVSGAKALWQAQNATLNLGGPNSTANFKFTIDAWHKFQSTTTGVTNIDTTGTFTVEPISTSLGPDQFNTGSPATAVMDTNFIPTTRVARMTIGKAGNTRAIQFGKAMTMGSGGELVVYGGTVTSSNAISAGTLAIDTSGTVTMGNASNNFANVAVKAASATQFNLFNAAPSWNAGTYAGVAGNYGVPAMLKASGTPPSTAAAGASLATYSVVATDSLGFNIASANTRSADALAVTASVKTGPTTALGGTTTQAGTAGSAISFSDLTFNAAGVHTLAFDATGFTQYVSPNITVTGGAPTLSLSYFSGTNTTNFVSATTTANPTFSSNNTSAAVYSTTTSAVCTVVTGTGVITTKTPGTCTIKVDQAADSTYLAGTRTVNVTINKTPQGALTITSTSGNYGSILELTTSGATVGALSFVVDSGTCTLATATTLNLDVVGSTCMITATRAGDANIAAVSSVSTSITVNKGNQSALITPTSISMTYLSAGLDLATLTYAGGSGTGSISFSTATSGCSISGSTLTSTLNASNSCTVTATKAGDSNYNVGTGVAFTIAVAKANQASLALTSTSATFGVDLALTSSGGSGTGAISYAVVSGSCTISSTNLTPTAATSCVVRATKAADTNYNSISSADTTVTIAKGTQATLTITSTSGAFGSVLTLTTSGGSDSGAVSFVVDSGTCSLASATTLTLGLVGDACMVTATKAATGNYNSISSLSTSIATVRASQATLVAPAGVTLTFADSNGLDLTTVGFTGGNGTGAISFTTSTAGCAIANNRLTSSNNAATTCVVASTKAADANFSASNIANLTVTIVKAAQAALVAPSGVTLVYANSSGLDLSTLTFTGGSGTGALGFSTSTAGCTVSNAVLTSTNNAASTCVVSVTKATDTNYLVGTPVNLTVTITKANQSAVTISSSATIEYLGSLTLAATGGSGTAAGYVFATSSPNCTVTGGVLTSSLGATNTCVITAYKAADLNYNASAVASQTVTIVKANQVSILNVPSGVTLVYASAGLNLNSLSYSGGDGTGAYTFSTSTVGCSISVSNVLTSTNNAATNCLVNVVKAADANYNASPVGVMQVDIIKATQAALTVTSLAATFGSNLSLTTTGGTSNGTVNFTKVSGSCSIAGAVLTPTGAGTCVVNATMLGGTNYNDVTSANATITIAKANQAPLVFNLSSTSVPYLGSLTLATSGGSGTGNVVFSVTAGSACTVSVNVLTPSTVGSVCEVQATKLGDANFNSIDATNQVITTMPIAQSAITFSNASVMTFGQTLTLSATGGNGSGALTYGVSNAGTTGCTLSGAVVSVTASGTCIVSAVRAASTNYLVSATAVQSITVNKAAQTITFTSTMPSTPVVGGTYAVAATSTSGATVVFSTPSTGCSIVGSTVTFSATGNCRIDANASTTAQYLAAPTVAQTVNVGQRNQTLTFDAATLAVTSKTFGDSSFAAVATSSVAGLQPVFSRGASTTNNACLVSSSGLVTIVAVGLCQIQADQAGDSNTAAANSATHSFSVIADIANAPTIVSVSAGDQSITAAFVRPSYTGGAAITGYQLTAIHTGGQVTFSGCQIVAGSDQTCTIGGLTNGTSYTVKVAAINSAGTGLLSAPSVSRVPATNPAAVTAFTAIPDNTSLRLSWGLPVSLGGGVFDSYRIFIKLKTDANYPLTYTSVNSLSTLDYTFTNLVNGTAYDVLIVTVTTANSLSLVSNTAEVRQTPRTVPDAPASISIFEVGSNLVISWTSPVSDGGNAITEYAARISGTLCALTAPTDTTCSIATPTAAGNYPIEVRAKNAAGLGEPIMGMFTKAAPPPPPVASNGGGFNEYVGMMILGLSSGKVSTAGGQILTLQTKNMDNLIAVMIDGVKVEILSMNANQLRLLMPKRAAGPVIIRFIAPNSTLEFTGISYAPAWRAALSGKVTIRNFIQENSVLSTLAKARLRSALAAVPGANSVTCIGYQSLSYNRPLDARTALRRAQTACNYLKSIKKSLVVKSSIARTSEVGAASRRLEVFFREGN